VISEIPILYVMNRELVIKLLFKRSPSVNLIMIMIILSKNVQIPLREEKKEEEEEMVLSLKIIFY